MASARSHKSNGKVHLRSRNDKDYAKYPAVVRALQLMLDETVIDGELWRQASAILRSGGEPAARHK